jgi:hypothetical protein
MILVGLQNVFELIFGSIWKGCTLEVTPIALEAAARYPMEIVWAWLSMALHEFVVSMAERDRALPTFRGKKQSKKNPLHVVQYFKDLLLESVFDKGPNDANNALLAGLKHEQRGYQIRPPRPDGSFSHQTTKSSSNPPKSTGTSKTKEPKPAAESITPAETTKKPPAEKTVCLRDLAYSKNLALPSLIGKDLKPCIGKKPDARYPCARLHSTDYASWSAQQIWEGVRTTGYLNEPNGMADAEAIKKALGLTA